ncbi:MAG: hypothetical protein GY940_02635 [bacterium]|nr:hypothetical protein [bacterium]
MKTIAGMKYVLFLMVMISALITAGCGQGGNDFTGKFTGNEIAIRLAKDGEKFTGSIHKGGMTFPLNAGAAGSQLTGTFKVGDSDFSFSASLDNDTMTLVTGNSSYTLTKEKKANPLEKANPLASNTTNPQPRNPLDTGVSNNPTGNTPPPGANMPTLPSNTMPQQNTMPPQNTSTENMPPQNMPSQNTQTTPPPGSQTTAPILPGGTPTGQNVPRNKNMATYQIKGGVSFDYPSGWNVGNTGELVRIIPNDAKVNAKGEPEEGFFIGFVPAQGITSINDPQVKAYFDNAMAQQRNIKRTGAGSPVQSTFGPAILLNYQGTASDGSSGQIGIYCVIRNNFALYLMHAGPYGSYSNRKADALNIFRSLRAGTPGAGNQPQPPGMGNGGN